MTVEQIVLERTFQEMGYISMADYAVKKAREELFRELTVRLAAVDILEEKYGMEYIEFSRKFHELTHVGLFEREDDSMDWRAELEVIRTVEKRLARLTV